MYNRKVMVNCVTYCGEWGTFVKVLRERSFYRSTCALGTSQSFQHLSRYFIVFPKTLSLCCTSIPRLAFLHFPAAPSLDLTPKPFSFLPHSCSWRLWSHSGGWNIPNQTWANSDSNGQDKMLRLEKLCFTPFCCSLLEISHKELIRDAARWSPSVVVVVWEPA